MLPGRYRILMANNETKRIDCIKDGDEIITLKNGEHHVARVSNFAMAMTVHVIEKLDLFGEQGTFTFECDPTQLFCSDKLTMAKDLRILGMPSILKTLQGTDYSLTRKHASERFETLYSFTIPNGIFLVQPHTHAPLFLCSTN